MGISYGAQVVGSTEADLVLLLLRQPPLVGHILKSFVTLLRDIDELSDAARTTTMTKWFGRALSIVLGQQPQRSRVW